jgi:hypothetical protein
MQYLLRCLAGKALVLAVVGCGPTVQPGLANAPALGKVPSADERVTDVVSNGHDSCERKLGPGPLRNQVPPCPTVSEPAPAVSITIRSPQTPDAGVDVDPWLGHLWKGWPCPREPYCAMP